MITRLDRFMKIRKVSPQKLAAVSGVTRQQIARIRKGARFRIDVMRRIVQGIRYLLREDVRASQLFDLGDERDYAELPILPPPKDGSENTKGV